MSNPAEEIAGKLRGALEGARIAGMRDGAATVKDAIQSAIDEARRRAIPGADMLIAGLEIAHRGAEAALEEIDELEADRQ